VPTERQSTPLDARHCGEDNWASLRVAEKLGFVEVSRRTYVILDRSAAG